GTGRQALARWFLAQSLGKQRREFLQLVDILWIAKKCKGQLPCLLKIAIVNLEALHRWKAAGQNVEYLGIKPQRYDEDRNATDREHSDAGPHQRATLGDGLGDEVADAHEQANIQHESARTCQCCSCARKSGFRSDSAREHLLCAVSEDALRTAHTTALDAVASAVLSGKRESKTE